MQVFPQSLKTRWLGLAAVAALVASTAAQDAIQFSKPADKDLSGKANAFTPPSARRNSADSVKAPNPVFGDRTPTVDFDPLPGSQMPSATAANTAQWRKLLENRKNWTLLTPKDILDAPTPEKILGVADLKDDPTLSPEERFMKRRQQMDRAAVTNFLQRSEASSWRADDSPLNPFHTRDAETRFAQSFGGSLPDPSRNSSVFFNGPNPNLPTGANLNPNANQSSSPWSATFGLPEPLSKPTPEQLAGVERFRAILDAATSPKPAEASRSIFSTPPVPDSDIQSSSIFNPVGRSFTPVENDVAKPMGIEPLPGITGPRPEKQPKNTSLVQPPPWLSGSSSPQMISPPQRQY